MSDLYTGLVNGMKWLLTFFYKATVSLHIPSYALAIIIFTVVIKLVLYPLNAKSMRSMKLMQVIQPKIKELQQKHKNDPQKAQAAIMELYKEYGANPFSGCLPMIIQLPILFSLFKALRGFKFENMAHAKFFWIANLSAKDPYYILPILAAGSTFLLQKMSTSAQDPTQRTMLYAMPLMFGYFSTQMPAGLVIYWVTFNLLGVVQQYIINKQPIAIAAKEASEKNEGNRKNRKNG